MKKKFLCMLLAVTMALSPTTVFADEKDDKIAELEAQVKEMQATIEELQAELAKYTEGTNQEEYKIGETWTVPGQWALTINSVEETADRNEYEERQPGAVYIVSYTYENLGYEDEYMDGLFLNIEFGKIVDSSGKMGYAYPGNVTMYPNEAPVGAVCDAQACIGVENPGSFKIHFSNYDGTSTNQSAVFSIDL